MGAAALHELIDPEWADALEPYAGRVAAMGDFLREEVRQGRGYLPSGQRVLRAFESPMSQVRVLIVGQDPYPTPGHAVGLSFSVPAQVRRLPPSLANIFTEYESDLGLPRPATGDLTPWSRAGVMLLNRVLTVTPGRPASHRGKGWEEITTAAVTALANRDAPTVAILWGRDAQSMRPHIDGMPVIASAHPSPLSASRGFFGSRPFSRSNELLQQHGAEPIDWRLPA
jgi:uracil-DNA glycosylase